MENFKEKKILSISPPQQGYGCYHYDVKYQGEWEDLELIRAVDKENSPFGGRVENIYSRDGIHRSEVICYYD